MWLAQCWQVRRRACGLLEFAEGLSFEFAVTPLGALFGLVASGCGLPPGCSRSAICRAITKSKTRFAAFYAVAVHAALAIAWSGNLLVLFVFYEILTFSPSRWSPTRTARRRAMPAGSI